jgi:hypothetical protein
LCSGCEQLSACIPFIKHRNPQSGPRFQILTTAFFHRGYRELTPRRRNHQLSSYWSRFLQEIPRSHSTGPHTENIPEPPGLTNPPSHPSPTPLVGSTARISDLCFFAPTLSEKTVARAAFDAALKRELQEVIQEAKQKANQIKEPADLWELERYLTRRRKNIDRADTSFVLQG